jgi:hypothetical protein
MDRTSQVLAQGSLLRNMGSLVTVIGVKRTFQQLSQRGQPRQSINLSSYHTIHVKRDTFLLGYVIHSVP